MRLTAAAPPETPRKPFYASLWAQVLLAIPAAVALGYFSPAQAIAMKPLGDAFIRLITMIITLIIFCTVVSGIAGMQDMKKVGRVGGKALLYFEIVSTLALLIGLRVIASTTGRPAGFLDAFKRKLNHFKLLLKFSNLSLLSFGSLLNVLVLL